MANLKSSQKDVRRIARRTERNTAVRSRLKTLGKKYKQMAASNDEQVQSTAREYVSSLDKAVKSGVIHANKAAREKARAAKLAKI